MKDSINLTKAELAIMQVLWQGQATASEGLSAKQINQSLADKHWQRTTLATMLTRLEEKGVVQRQKASSGNGYLYRAL